MKLEVALQEQVDEVTGVYYKLFKEVVDTNVTAFQDFFQKMGLGIRGHSFGLFFPSINRLH